PHEPVSAAGDVAQENIAALNAVHAARPVLEELGRETDKTVGMTVWGNLGPTVIWWCEGSRPLQTRVRSGLVVSLLNSSSGALFAAFAPREVTGPLLEAELAQQKPGEERFKTRGDLEGWLDRVRADRLGAIFNVVNPGINERGHTAFAA